MCFLPMAVHDFRAGWSTDPVGPVATDSPPVVDANAPLPLRFPLSASGRLPGRAGSLKQVKPARTTPDPHTKWMRGKLKRAGWDNRHVLKLVGSAARGADNPAKPMFKNDSRAVSGNRGFTCGKSFNMLLANGA